MNRPPNVRGIELRYMLTMHLVHNGRATITDLIGALTNQGFAVDGGPPKSVSDALRWEMRRGRVRRIRRGLYGPGSMPRSTEYRMHQRVGVVAARRAHRRIPSSLGQLRSPSGAAVLDLVERDAAVGGVLTRKSQYPFANYVARHLSCAAAERSGLSGQIAFADEHQIGRAVHNARATGDRQRGI